ncbi:MAG TPA: hypothetical protein VMU42_11275 [Candidatus Sulfotelmatobacter sp.]|nr:hypothetical protein [Candidatus Sulfotelmatobacter sp.]
MKFRLPTSRLRVVPLTIFAAAILAGLKLGQVLDLASAAFGVPPAQAATEADQTPHKATGAPLPLTPAGAKRADTATQTAPAEAPAKAAPPAPAAAAAQPAAPPPAAASTPAPGAAPPAQPAAPATADNSVMPAPASEAPKAPPPPPTPPKRDPTTFTQAEVDLLQNLSTRRDELDKRAKDIEMRESVLAATAKKVDEKIAALKQIQDNIQALLKQRDAADERSLKSLVKVYENMKPKDAARIFEKLDMPILLQVVERMKERNLAAILAEMDPAKAKSITIELATQHELPTKAPAGNG